MQVELCGQKGTLTVITNCINNGTVTGTDTSTTGDIYGYESSSFSQRQYETSKYYLLVFYPNVGVLNGLMENSQYLMDEGQGDDNVNVSLG